MTDLVEKRNKRLPFSEWMFLRLLARRPLS